MPPVLVSGGAIGADSHWARLAAQHNHLIIHMSFKGHRVSSDQQRGRVLLSSQLLKEAGGKLKAISKLLNRVIPSNLYVRNLIRRNYCISLVSSIYVIDTKFDGTSLKSLGGSAWAAASYWHNGGRELYVWNGDWYRITGLEQAQKCSPPTPAGRYAGIGERKLTPAGRLAIERLVSTNN